MDVNNTMSIEKHHAAYDRVLWMATRAGRIIRQNTWLIPPIDAEVHDALHDKIVTVPLLDRFTADKVARDFIPIRDDYIGSVDSLIGSIERALADPRTGELQKGMGQLTIAALEMEKPIIREGLAIPSTTTIIDLGAAA